MQPTLRKGYGGGWVAEFENEDALMSAAKAMLESGLKHWDVFSPYPCEAARLSSMRAGVGRKSLLTGLGVCGGLLGGLVVVLWLYLTREGLSTPLINQGREHGAALWFAYVPPVFEGILLGAGLCLGLGFLWVSRLPVWFDWVFAGRAISEKASSEAFFIVADEWCGDEARQVLEAQRPLSLEWVEERESRDREDQEKEANNG